MTEVIVTCPICARWRADLVDGLTLQQLADDLAKHMQYCAAPSSMVQSVKAILRDAAGKVLAFDPDLAVHLSDLASDYAGPYIEEAS